MAGTKWLPIGGSPVLLAHSSILSRRDVRKPGSLRRWLGYDRRQRGSGRPHHWGGTLLRVAIRGIVRGRIISRPTGEVRVTAGAGSASRVESRRPGIAALL